MARTRGEDKRTLSLEEFELVRKTRYPDLKALDGSELASLRSSLRDLRDRSQDEAKSARREILSKRGSSGTKSPANSTATPAKRDLLAAAVKRANKEAERRRVNAAATAQLVTNAREALAMKQAFGAGTPDIPSSQTANEGMRSIPNADQAPSGAFNAEGDRVVLERSRKVR